ncbi:MAG: tetratricopeptide repeat protein [Candidatus Muiribacteriota bacterium]
MKTKTKFFILVFFFIVITFKLKEILSFFMEKRAENKVKKLLKVLENNEDIQEKSATLYMIGNIYLFDLKDYQEAINYYSKIIEMENRNYLEDSALFNSGLAHLKKGEKNEARDNFMEIIHRYPETARAKDAELEISRL